VLTTISRDQRDHSCRYFLSFHHLAVAAICLAISTLAWSGVSPRLEETVDGKPLWLPMPAGTVETCHQNPQNKTMFQATLDPRFQLLACFVPADWVAVQDPAKRSAKPFFTVSVDRQSRTYVVDDVQFQKVIASFLNPWPPSNAEVASIMQKIEPLRVRQDATFSDASGQKIKTSTPRLMFIREYDRAPQSFTFSVIKSAAYERDGARISETSAEGQSLIHIGRWVLMLRISMPYQSIADVKYERSQASEWIRNVLSANPNRPR